MHHITALDTGQHQFILLPDIHQQSLVFLPQLSHLTRSELSWNVEAECATAQRRTREESWETSGEKEGNVRGGKTSQE